MRSIDILTECINRVNRLAFMTAGKCWCCGLFTTHKPGCMAYRSDPKRLLVKLAAN